MNYPHVSQHSQEDCGAACLASISKYYGRNITINHTREAVGTGQMGTTLLGLKRGAEILGFNARAVRTSPDFLNRLNEVSLPAILHWKGSHWVVLFGQKGKKCAIADPAVGILYLSKKELKQDWEDRVLLLLEPDPIRFSEQSDEKVGGLGRFFKRAWSYRQILLQVLPINIFLGLLSLAFPFLIQILTDEVLVRGDLKLLTTVAILVIAMNVVSSSLKLVQSNLIAHFAQRLELGLVMEFGWVILRLPLSYYENRRSGEIVSRLRDIQQINQLVSQVIVSLPSQIFVALISLGLMLFYSWKLTILAVFISLVMTLSLILFQPYLQQKTRRLLVTEAENQGVLVETFKGALTLKTTSAIPHFWEELQGRFSRRANLSFGTLQISIINENFSDLVSGAGSVALLWFGGSLVISPSEQLSIGQLLAFNAMNSNFLTLISTIINFVDEFTRAKTATQHLTEIIDTTLESKNEHKKPSVTISPKSDLVCRNLNFHYPGRIELIENFSLTIPGGKVVALIGQSGCGKSTLAKLISGLYMFQSGNIQIGNYNLQDVSLDCLRKQVVLVPQEPHFWSRSILDNFRICDPHVTFEQITNACIIADVDEFICKLSNKYQTILGEFGANISGGQRQRLAIARAVISDPPVLILDESTAGLDPVSEAKVLEQLLEHRRGKTTIIISHRPRVVSKADWIIYLENGKLESQGNKLDLLTQSGNHLNFMIP